jgi:8-oxo-dGTP diphosphatase
MSSLNHRPFKISVLVFARNAEGKFLLLQRTREPNRGLWSPIGGKLEMALGESPFECAIRETQEEIGLTVSETDLHLFSIVSEKDYEGSGHWLMFLFECHQRIETIPPAIDEGIFAFFSRDEIEELFLPETDRDALWPLYDRYHDGFVCLRANCSPHHPLEVVIEEGHENIRSPMNTATSHRVGWTQPKTELP